MTAHPEWLQDQIDTATKRMASVIDLTPRLHLHKTGELPADLDAMADLLADEAFVKWVSGGTKTCPHLRRGPQPTVLFVWHAEEALCLQCATLLDLSIVGTDQNVTCDCCGVTDPNVKFYPLGIVKGYVTISGGVCDRCHDRAVASSHG